MPIYFSSKLGIQELKSTLMSIKGVPKKFVIRWFEETSLNPKFFLLIAQTWSVISSLYSEVDNGFGLIPIISADPSQA